MKNLYYCYINNNEHKKVVELSKKAHLFARDDCNVSDTEKELNNVVEKILLK